jgi:tetratricopeptide (TPR) repeat protein
MSLLLVLSKYCFCDNTTQIIKQADSLVSLNKFNSAFLVLRDADSGNDNPAIALKKSRIALDYFVTAIMHHIFAFIDLKPGENISNYRRKVGSYSMYPLEINNIMLKLIKKYPRNWALYQMLGEYYYEVSYKYDGKWDESNDSLYAKSSRNYKIAIANNVYDSKSFYVLGYIDLFQKKYDSAIQNFMRSLSLNDTDATTNYNLAYAYLYKNKRDSTIKYGMKAFSFYENGPYKADAATMVGVTYKELGNKEKSLEYLEKALIVYPNLDNITGALSLSLELGLFPKAQDISEKLFNLGPDNPTTLQTVTSVYFKYHKQDKLPLFFSKIEKDQKSFQVLGNIYFHEAIFYKDIEDKENCRKYFKLAKKQMENDSKKNEKPLELINQELNKL